MRIGMLVVLAALAGCADVTPPPTAIGKGRIYMERPSVRWALNDANAYCAGQGKPFVAVKMEHGTRNHLASVTFTCG